MVIKYQNNKNSLLSLKGLKDSENILKKLINHYLDNQDSVAVCFLDIGNFKFYNYMFGYEYGDIVLDAVFNKVEKCVSNDGYVYRLGGDILLILLYKMNCKREVNSIIKKIVDVFCKPMDIAGEKIRVLINMGISLYPNDSKEVNTIIKYAEIALTYTKNQYAERYKFFQYEMYEEIIKKGKIEADILKAIDNEEFILYYQPQIDINTMEVYGMEALLRWNHPEYGILPPSYFIEIIEENGMINEIGKFVFHEACSEIMKWHKLGYCNLRMSINISEKQFDDSSFLIFIEEILNRTQVEPKYINIEITERMLIKPKERILDIFTALKNKGIKIFIDDFGTKYSSLNYLYCFQVDGIKIDKSFVDRIHSSEKEFIITKNIVNLANELNLEIVAEGVEINEQLNSLVSISCKKIQGFIFGKPVISNEFVKVLEKYNK